MRKNKKSRDLKKAFVFPKTTMAEAIEKLDRNHLGILLLIDQSKQLLGVITEGDIRKAIFKKYPFHTPCSEIANLNPLTVSKPIQKAKVLHLMDHGRKMLIHQLPVVDPHGRVVDLVLRNDLIHRQKPLKLSVVIMAGGYGLRMRPLTEKIPKPLLCLKKRTLIHWIIRQLAKYGIKDVMIAVHYKAGKIKNYIESEEKHGVRIKYLYEKQPLGTAGVLSRIKNQGVPILVINSDILTRVNIRALAEHHKKHQGVLTAAVYRYDVKIEYGVAHMKGYQIAALDEKPIVSYFVNAGIYLLEPSVIRHIPRGERMDMTDLINSLIQSGLKIVGYPLCRYWLDVGRPEDYNLAMKLERYHEKSLEG